MKKALCAIGLLAMFALVSPVFAQGPFTDVPTDHWAYEAVNQLAQDGIIVGYPDGTFGGKRALTRFEFAQALARAIPILRGQTPSTPTGFASAADLAKVSDRVTALEKATPSVSAADLAAMKKAVDEFKDELASMGVDIDAVKRDLAALDKRVTALEDEMKRVKITGAATVFAIGEDTDSGAVVDRDNIGFAADDKLLEGISLVKEIDLTITGKVAEDAMVVATINAGNYLDYLGGVVNAYQFSTRNMTPIDSFFPYYLYAQFPLWTGDVKVGRLPAQWGPYTLKLPDVDSYTMNAKTDSGDYPVDGISAAWKFGGFGLEALAAKVDSNELLGTTGLTSAITGAISAAPGQAFGGLNSIDQFAGARVTIGLADTGNIGLSYLEGAGPDATDGVNTWDTARLMAADADLMFGKIKVGAVWGKTDLIHTTGGGSDLDDDNTALDANLGFDIGALDLKAGWKSIDVNYAAPGFWDKIGRVANPTNVEGPYAELKYGLGESLKLCAAAEFLSAKKNASELPGTNLPVVLDEEDDDIKYYTAGLKWGFMENTSLDLGMEWVKWEPTTASAAAADEKYITVGLGHQWGNVKARVGYQIIDFDADGATGGAFDDADYKGNLAVAQVSVKF